MIASLRGQILDGGPGHVVVDVSGVGYLVLVSTQTAREIPGPGAEVFLHTHQIVREDALQLFGFFRVEECRLFELLITVSGIGPRVAIAVLSGLDAAALARAILDENIAQLVSIPGVGRKTAERLVIELRDKIDVLGAASPRPAAPTPAAGVLPRGGAQEDAVAALVRLGYSQAQSLEAVRQIGAQSPEASLETLVRQALGRLSKAVAAVR